MWKLIENKLHAKYNSSETIVSAKQLEKLMKLKFKKKHLKSRIPSLKTNCGCQIGEDLMIAAIVKGWSLVFRKKLWQNKSNLKGWG